MNSDAANENAATYNVWEPKLEGLTTKIARLNKRAVKLGVSPLVVDVRRAQGVIEVAREEFIDDAGKTVPALRLLRIPVVITGSTVKLDGWSFAGVLESTAEGNIIRKSPDCTIDLAQFASRPTWCDHCKVNRNRSTTYVVVNDDGRTAQVGSTCIRDFLGHDAASAIAQAELWYSLAELGAAAEDSDGEFEGGARGKEYVETDLVLNAAAQVLRYNAYVSSATARDTDGESTGDLVRRATGHFGQWEWDTIRKDPELARKIALTIEDESKVEAAEARQFVLDEFTGRDNLTDFESNLFIAAKAEYIPRKVIGISAYIVEYRRRAIHKAAEAKASEYINSSVHFGEVGGKRTKGVEIRYINSRSFDSDFGTVYFHRFWSAAANALLVWKTGTDSLEYTNEGDTFLADFSIKAHDEYKGVKQTQITRAKLTPQNELATA